MPIEQSVLDRLSKIFIRLGDENNGERSSAIEGFLASLRTAKIDLRDLRLVADGQERIDRQAETEARLADARKALRMAYPDRAKMADRIEQLERDLREMTSKSRAHEKARLTAELKLAGALEEIKRLKSLLKTAEREAEAKQADRAEQNEAKESAKQAKAAERQKIAEANKQAKAAERQKMAEAKESAKQSAKQSAKKPDLQDANIVFLLSAALVEKDRVIAALHTKLASVNIEYHRAMAWKRDAQMRIERHPLVLVLKRTVRILGDATNKYPMTRAEFERAMAWLDFTMEDLSRWGLEDIPDVLPSWIAITLRAITRARHEE